MYWMYGKYLGNQTVFCWTWIYVYSVDPDQLAFETYWYTKTISRRQVITIIKVNPTEKLEIQCSGKLFYHSTVKSCKFEFVLFGFTSSLNLIYMEVDKNI